MLSKKMVFQLEYEVLAAFPVIRKEQMCVSEGKCHSHGPFWKTGGLENSRRVSYKCIKGRKVLVVQPKT